MALKEDRITILVNFGSGQFIGKINPILERLDVDYVNDINEHKQDSSDHEIAFGGSWGNNTLGSYWRIELFVSDLGDGRCVIDLFALGEGSAKKGLRVMFGLGISDMDMRGLSLSNGMKMRAKIIDALGGQILPDDRREQERIIWPTAELQPQAPQQRPPQICAGPSVKHATLHKSGEV